MFSFFNRVSGAHQLEEPQQFYGGIVADPMGLGKTLTMIALAATDLDGDDAQIHLDVGGDNKRHTPATLIVVPPPRRLALHTNLNALLLTLE